MKVFLKGQTQNFKEKLASFFKKYKKSLVFASLFGLAAVALLFTQSLKKPTLPQAPVPTSAPETVSQAKIPSRQAKTLPQTESLAQDLLPSQPPETGNPPPQLNFENYQLTNTLPSLPEKITLYFLKTNYSDQEVKDFASQFGLFDVQPAGDNWFTAKNLTNARNFGYLKFNQKTGAFSFYSFGFHRPQTTPSNQPADLAQSFLKEKGLWDETLTFHASYQKIGVEDVTFIEFHRDWEKAGLPILNLIGLLNLDESVKLTDFKLGQVDPETPADVTIINASDGSNGKARPNDFNTISVGVTGEGQILFIDSNLRLLEKSEVLTTQNTTYLAPEQAFEEIKKGKGLFQLSTPAGQGSTDFTRVYPANLAQASQAMVTDFVLAYLEKPPTTPNTQTFLQPVYIFKGTAELDSGYRTAWIQAVPAIVNTQISLPDVLGETIKLGTFTPPPTPTSTPAPTTFPTPTSLPPSPTSPPSSPCVPDEAHLDPVYNLAGLGRVGQFTIEYEDGQEDYRQKSPKFNNQWYFIPPQDQPLPNLNQVLAEFQQLDLDPYLYRLRTTAQIVQDWYDDPNCPKRLTGGSPTLFVYAPEGTELTIKPQFPLTYSDPPLQKCSSELQFAPSWRLLASPNGTLIPASNLEPRTSNYSHPYLYYEYEPITFQKPKNGWTVKKSELETFARQTVSPALKLTPLEENRLVFELAHAAFDLEAENVFIGLIDPKEVNKKLPLIITPGVIERSPSSEGGPERSRRDSSDGGTEPINPTILRFHFYLSKASEKNLSTPPELLPIPRSDFMLLELGATRGALPTPGVG